jgi:hypothetical protein
LDQICPRHSALAFLGRTVAINGSRPQDVSSRTTMPASPLHRVVRPIDSLF